MATKDSLITGIRTRGIAVADLDDIAVGNIIDEALYEYSRYRPLIKVTTFATVADQQAYTWTEIGDTAGISVILGKWNPYQSDDEWDLAATMAAIGIPYEAGYWHLPSQDTLNQIKAAAWDTNYGGQVYQNDTEGGDVYLTPTPNSAGRKIYLLYTAKHTTLTTIKDSDRDVYLDLTESMCASRVVKEIANKSSAEKIVTPEYTIEIAKKINFWRDQAQALRTQFIDKCNAGHVAAGRT